MNEAASVGEVGCGCIRSVGLAGTGLGTAAQCQAADVGSEVAGLPASAMAGPTVVSPNTHAAWTRA